MNRRDFTKNLGASALTLALAPTALAQNDKNNIKHITILHTNDTHSHLDPLPANDPKNPGQGGIARRAKLIEQIRLENPNTLLFDAGDIFQGTPYFNYYGGELEFKLMSMLKYDAATLGNHDFDNGIDGLFAQTPHAKFDFICSNYGFSNTIMNGKTKQFKVYELGGVKIGVYGIGIELEGLVDKKMYKETKWLDPVGVSQDMEQILKFQYNCDIVICLSHIGYRYEKPSVISDLTLAPQTSYTDLFIGGHTHTFLKKPTIIPNKIGKPILINQTGCYGVNLGRIDFYLGSNMPANGVSINV